MKRSGRGTYPTAIADRPAAHAAAMPHALRQRRRRCCPLGETSQRAEHQKMREVKVGLECIHAPRSTAPLTHPPSVSAATMHSPLPQPQPPLAHEPLARRARAESSAEVARHENS